VGFLPWSLARKGVPEGHPAGVAEADELGRIVATDRVNAQAEWLLLALPWQEHGACDAPLHAPLHIRG